MNAALTLILLVLTLAGWAVVDRRAAEKKILARKAKKKAYLAKLKAFEARQSDRKQRIGHL